MSQKIKYLTLEQLDRLLKVITNPRDRAIFTTVYWRGLRASEVALIQYPEHWEPDSGRLYVTRLKGGNSGQYPTEKGEARAIRAWIRDRGDWPGPLFCSERRTGISRQQLDNLMRHYGREAEIPEDLRHMHVLRHSVGTHMTSDGKSLQQVADWLGHRDLKSTMIYAKLTNKARDNTALSFYESRNPTVPKVKFSRNRR
jgi:site-specific recombinase XerD